MNRDINKIINEVNESFALTYDDPTHKYTTNVTDDMKSISKLANVEEFDYSRIKNIQFLADIGSDFHYVIEQLNAGEPIDTKIFKTMEMDLLLEKVEPTLKKGLTSIYDKIGVKKFYPELMVTTGYCAGRFDLLAEREDGSLVLIDYKTSSSLMFSHKLQINMYRVILKEYYGIEVNEMYLIKVDKEDYSVHPHKVDMFKDKHVTTALKGEPLTTRTLNSLKGILKNSDKVDELLDKKIEVEQKIKNLKSKLEFYTMDLENLKQDIEMQISAYAKYENDNFVVTNQKKQVFNNAQKSAVPVELLEDFTKKVEVEEIDWKSFIKEYPQYKSETKTLVFKERKKNA